jgi:hypothetical protein
VSSNNFLLAHLTQRVMWGIAITCRPSVNLSYFNLLLWNNWTKLNQTWQKASIIRSSIKFLHFVPFRQQIWPPRAILVSDWLLFKKIFSSETAWQNGANLGRKHLCKILYKASSFGSIRPTNMAVKISSFLAHLTQRVMWGIAITWRPSSVR